jgi:hypothetical protein
MKALTAIAMIALALALAACGDDDEDASQGTNAQTDVTRTTPTTEDGETASEERAAKRKSRSSDAKQKSGSDTRKRGSDTPKTTNSGRGDTSEQSDSDRNRNANRSDELYSKKDAENLSSELVARGVCQRFLPKQTERDLKAGRTTIQKVAREYSQGWPSNKRDEAYKGCLAGLKARK